MNIPIINLDFDLTKPYEILFGYCQELRIPCIKQFNQLFDITGNALIHTFNPMKKNEYTIDANRIRFNYNRFPTPNESHFTIDYDKIINYKSIASLERFGNGVYCDGLTSPGAITLTFQSNSIHSGSADPYYHPDIDDSSAINTQPINIMSVEDCFWVFGNNRCMFTADIYTPEITESH